MCRGRFARGSSRQPDSGKMGILSPMLSKSLKASAPDDAWCMGIVPGIETILMGNDIEEWVAYLSLQGLGGGDDQGLGLARTRREEQVAASTPSQPEPVIQVT